MLANIRNTQIHYELLGDGAPLFLLPGGPGFGSELYKKHHLPLAAHNQLVFFDPRGCGKSINADPSTYDLENYIEDVEVLRQHLGYEKISMLGKSYGGIVAQGYVLRYPQHINKLILAATTTGHQFITEATQNLHAMGNAAQIQAGTKLLTGKIESVTDALNVFQILESLYSDQAESKPLVDPKEFNPNIEALNLGFSQFLRQFDFAPDLHKISHPTLIIGGEHDWVCDAKYSKLLHQKIVGSNLVMLDAGHSVDNDQPEQYLAAVSRFLDS